MSGSAVDFTTSSFSYSEFVLVKARKKRKNRVRQPECRSLSTLLQRIRDEMSQDEWFSQCQSIIKDSLRPLADESSLSVLCLGLGSPSESAVSRIQLAFLTELCLALNIDCANVSIYDPVFSPVDLELFEGLRFQVLSENRNGEYPLQGPTICYMPHCDMGLYDSFLRANCSEDQLLALVLLANRLEEYLENNSHHKLQGRVPYLLKIAPVLQCRPLPPSKAWPTAFNNTSVQYVPFPDTLS